MHAVIDETISVLWINNFLICSFEWKFFFCEIQRAHLKFTYKKTNPLHAVLLILLQLFIIYSTNELEAKLPNQIEICTNYYLLPYKLQAVLDKNKPSTKTVLVECVFPIFLEIRTRSNTNRIKSSFRAYVREISKVVPKTEKAY